MPHVHTGNGQHDLTISAFIINSETNSLLLHQHKILGVWLQPGGHVELNENPWQALTHELAEETGYDITQLNVLQTSPVIPGLVEAVQPTPLVQRTHEFPTTTGNTHYHTDLAYGFVADNDYREALAEGESDVVEWFSAERLAALPDDSIVADTRTIGLYLLENYKLFNQVSANIYS